MKKFLKGLLLIIASVFILAAYPAPAFLQENANAEKPVVYFGLIPLYTPSLMYERFQPLMDYLSDNTSFRFKMRLTKDYKGIVTLLEDDSIDIALLGGASYIIAKSKTEVVPLVRPLNPQGKPFYKSVIIAREDKDIKGISDLKGRSFAFASRWSTSGAVVPLYQPVNPKNHTDAKEMAKLSTSDVENVIRDGGAATSKSTMMPPFGKSMTEAEIKDLVAYLSKLCNCKFKKE